VIPVSVRWALIVSFLRLLFAGRLRLEMRSRRRLSDTERALNRRLARVKQRERNELTPVEFLGGTVLGIWYGLRRRFDLVGLVRRRGCINWAGFCVVNGEKLKILMCVLASVRNFSIVCFEGVTGNSVCGALSVRSGRPLAIFEVTTGSILASFGGRAIVTSLPQTAGT
jgi:hypothetical protein